MTDEAKAEISRASVAIEIAAAFIGGVGLLAVLVFLASYA